MSSSISDHLCDTTPNITFFGKTLFGGPTLIEYPVVQSLSHVLHLLYAKHCGVSIFDIQNKPTGRYLSILKKRKLKLRNIIAFLLIKKILKIYF